MGPTRISTIRSCDQLVILQHGRVECVGTPSYAHNESKLYRFATGEIEAGQMNA